MEDNYPPGFDPRELDDNDETDLEIDYEGEEVEQELLDQEEEHGE